MDKKLNRTIGYRPNGTKAFEGKVNASELIKELYLPPTVEESDLLEAVNKVNNGESLTIYNGNRSVAFNPPQMSLEYRSKRIVDWLKSHPLINKAGLCQAVGFDKGNFKRICDIGLQFKPDVIDLLEEQLSLYGY